MVVQRHSQNFEPVGTNLLRRFDGPIEEQEEFQAQNRSLWQVQKQTSRLFEEAAANIPKCLTTDGARDGARFGGPINHSSYAPNHPNGRKGNPNPNAAAPPADHESIRRPAFFRNPTGGQPAVPTGKGNIYRDRATATATATGSSGPHHHHPHENYRDYYHRDYRAEVQQYNTEYGDFTNFQGNSRSPVGGTVGRSPVMGDYEPSRTASSYVPTRLDQPPSPAARGGHGYSFHPNGNPFLPGARQERERTADRQADDSRDDWWSDWGTSRAPSVMSHEASSTNASSAAHHAHYPQPKRHHNNQHYNRSYAGFAAKGSPPPHHPGGGTAGKGSPRDYNYANNMTTVSSTTRGDNPQQNRSDQQGGLINTDKYGAVYQALAALAGKKGSHSQNSSAPASVTTAGATQSLRYAGGGGPGLGGGPGSAPSQSSQWGGQQPGQQQGPRGGGHYAASASKSGSHPSGKSTPSRKGEDTSPGTFFFDNMVPHSTGGAYLGQQLRRLTEEVDDSSSISLREQQQPRDHEYVGKGIPNRRDQPAAPPGASDAEARRQELLVLLLRMLGDKQEPPDGGFVVTGGGLGGPQMANPQSHPFDPPANGGNSMGDRHPAAGEGPHYSTNSTGRDIYSTSSLPGGGFLAPGFPIDDTRTMARGMAVPHPNRADPGTYYSEKWGSRGTKGPKDVHGTKA